MRQILIAVGIALTVSGEGAGAAGGASRVPVDRTNLVWRAAELLAQHAGVPADATVDISKSIPAAAGLAGGLGQLREKVQAQ